MTKKKAKKEYFVEEVGTSDTINKKVPEIDDCFKCVSKCLQNDEIRFFILLKLLGDVKKVIEKNGTK